MKLYRLKNKKVLLFTDKACDFLKAYTTNVSEAPRNAFVDIHGKIVAVFDQKKINEGKVWAVIEKQYFDRLKKHLEKYLSLGTTRMEETDHLVYFDLDGDFRPHADEIIIPQNVGTRSIAGAQLIAPLLIVSRREYPSDISDEDFVRFRVKNNIPLQGVDYDEEMVLNVGDEEFVSYTKGCYLGQEIVARVHHRGKPPRKLVVQWEADCTAAEKGQMTSKVQVEEGQDLSGFIFMEN